MDALVAGTTVPHAGAASGNALAHTVANLAAPAAASRSYRSRGAWDSVRFPYGDRLYLGKPLN